MFWAEQDGSMNIMTSERQAPKENAAASLATIIPGLTQTERTALESLPSVRRFVGRTKLITAEAQRLEKLRLIVRGWAMKSIGLPDDRRQIIGFALPGNLEGLYGDFRQPSTCDVTTLTRCEVAEFSMREVLTLSNAHAGIAAGFRMFMSREAAILGDQVLRLGRMTAYERVCHFLLETFDRQNPHGPDGTSVEFPLTQAIVADVLGLSVVHVNRQVMRLRHEGLLDMDRRSLTIYDFNRLKAISGYKSRRIEAVPEYSSVAD